MSMPSRPSTCPLRSAQYPQTISPPSAQRRSCAWLRSSARSASSTAEVAWAKRESYSSSFHWLKLYGELPPVYMTAEAIYGRLMR